MQTIYMQSICIYICIQSNITLLGLGLAYNTDTVILILHHPSPQHRHFKKKEFSTFLSSIKNKAKHSKQPYLYHNSQILSYTTLFITSSQKHHDIDLQYGEHCQTESINILGEFSFLQANHIQLLETHELKGMSLVLFF